MLRSERGAATVEHAGLVLMLALLFTGMALALLTDPPEREARSLGSAIARKLRCAAQGPGPCWQDPLTEAYGRSVGGVVRAFAPIPTPLSGLLPVDFRRCRQARCALPGDRPELTASNRRVSAFVSVDDRRRSHGIVQIDYWLYRPTFGWERIRRSASASEVVANAMTPLLDTDHPVLIPLETLPGRNHVRFPPAEEPPWRWRVE